MWAAAAEQTIAVEPGTSYTITWWYKATPGTGTFNLYVMNAVGYANLTSTGGKNYMNNFTGGWEQGTYVVNSGDAEAIILKFSTEASNPGTIIVDDVAIEKTGSHTHEYIGTVTKQPTCGATGVKTFTCSCGEGTYTETIPATGAHIYDNACDTSCNVCGATRTVSHSYSGACDRYCNLCGAKKVGLGVSAQHTYDNACDADCNVCGEIRSVTDHTYDNACDTDCNTCGAVRQASHSYKAVVTAPTCTAQGYTTYTCTVCGDSYKGNYTDALGHDWIAADCDTAKTCRVCGATEGDALGHTYDDEYDATCNDCGDVREVPEKPVGGIVYGDADGNGLVELADASLVQQYLAGYDVIVKVGADADGNGLVELADASLIQQYLAGYDVQLGPDSDPDQPEEPHVCDYVGEVIKAADCTHDGEKRYTCSGCGNSYTEPIAALGHKYNSVVTAPDCENEGYTTYTCAACGDSYVANQVAALGHKYNSVVTAPDCENEGYTTYTCSVCDDSYVANQVAALGHKYNSVVTAPDCKNEGYTTYTCANCGDSYVANQVTALGHHHVGTVTKEATCGTDGVMTYTCSCGDSYTEAIAATGKHAYDNEYDTTCNYCGEVRDLPVNDGELLWPPIKKGV